MLQDLIQDLQSTLKNYSQGLAKQNLLVDIPWTMVDGDLNLQRLIFRKDNSLYIVREGEIQESKWEYLPAMNSLVIEIGGRKILMNEVFADGKALILKRDGVSLEFLCFANQKELTDLNLLEYLDKLINVKKLSEGSSIDSTVSKKKSEEGILLAFVAFFIVVLVIISLIPGASKQGSSESTNQLIESNDYETKNLEDLKQLQQKQAELTKERIKIFDELMKDPVFRKKYASKNTGSGNRLEGAIDIRSIPEVEIELLKRGIRTQ